MAAVFRTGFGSKSDAQSVHQPVVRKLVAHLNSNCKTISTGDTTRRAEMIIILQHAVDKLLDIDGNAKGQRPGFNVTDEI